MHRLNCHICPQYHICTFSLYAIKLDADRRLSILATLYVKTRETHTINLHNTHAHTHILFVASVKHHDTEGYK